MARDIDYTPAFEFAQKWMKELDKKPKQVKVKILRDGNGNAVRVIKIKVDKPRNL